MAKNSKRQTSRAAKAKAQPKITFTETGPKLTQRQLSHLELLTVTDKLPSDFQKFLLKHNGGIASPDLFEWRRGREDRSATLDRLLGFDPSRLDDRRGLDLVSATLRWRDELPRFSLPIGIVDRDDLLLLFTFGPRRGQVWIKDWEQVSPLVNKPTNPEGAVYFVADSFSDFLGMLHKPVDEGCELSDQSDILFALDSPKVRGEHLKKTLKKLGCKVFRYPGVKGLYLPPAWQWPKYRMEGTRPAGLFEETNKHKYGEIQLDARPLGHKILRILVTRAHRAPLFDELSAALGADAVPMNI